MMMPQGAWRLRFLAYCQPPLRRCYAAIQQAGVALLTISRSWSALFGLSITLEMPAWAAKQETYADAAEVTMTIQG